MTTIAEQVSHLTESMAAQPPNEVMGAFTREQAGGQPAGSRRVVVHGREERPDLQRRLRPGQPAAEAARAAQLQLGPELAAVTADGTVEVWSATGD